MTKSGLHVGLREPWPEVSGEVGHGGVAERAQRVGRAAKRRSLQGTQEGMRVVWRTFGATRTERSDSGAKMDAREADLRNV